MNAQSSNLYRQLDASKKDAKWFDSVITLLRRDWQPLANRDKVIRGRQILFSQQSMEDIKANFQDKEFLRTTEFRPLGIFARMLNILVEELRSDPPEIQVRANDESAMLDKQSDIKRLSTFTAHQAGMSELNSRVGLPPLPSDDTKYKTNIKQMMLYGLDPSDKDDIEFFHRNDFIRLKQEIALQKLINAIFKNIRFDEEMIMDGVIDILTSNSFTTFNYVDEVSGEQKIERKFPEEVLGIWGNKRDGKKDICNGFVSNVTLRDWISMAGNDFDFERDWYQLLWALNYSNKSTYTGFSQGQRQYNCKDNVNYDSDRERYNNDTDTTGDFGGGYLDWDMAFNYKVQVGYIEFCSIDASKTWLEKKNGKKFDIGKIVPYDYELDDMETTQGYAKESLMSEQFYKSYFLPTSGISQWIYNFGKVRYQELEGANDELSCGNMVVYRQEGQTATEISEHYIYMANLAAYKILWLLSKVEPNKEEYVWQEILELATLFRRELAQDNPDNPAYSMGNIIEDIVKTQKTSHVRLRAMPKINGRTAENLHKIEVQSQGDPAAMWIQQIEKWAEDSIAEKIGLNDVRMGQVQNARKGFKMSENETQQSQKSTGYIYRIIQYVKERAATKVISTTQDVLMFEDSIACGWIRTMIGELEYNNLKSLTSWGKENKAAHRLGLFVDNYNTAAEKQRVLQAADMALANQDGKGGIDLTEWGIVTREKDPRAGLSLLEKFREKERKRIRREALEDMKMKQDHEKQMAQASQQAQQAHDAQELKRAAIPAQAQVQVAQLNNAGKKEIKEMTIENDPAKQQHRADSQKDLVTHKADVEERAPF